MKRQKSIFLGLGIIVISTAFAGASLRDGPQNAGGAKQNDHKPPSAIADYNLLRSQKNAAIAQEDSKSTVQAKTADPVDTSEFPIVNLTTPQPLSADEHKKREAKGKRYNRKYAPRITESTDQIFYISDWDSRLPALPIMMSSAVIVGKVTDAHAYLSNDQSDIYSEFTLYIDQVLKNGADSRVGPGDSINVERKGGRLRFPSGKIVVSITNHQQLPRVGRRYVLFLTHAFPMGGEITDFYILTGYELANSHVYPLDAVAPAHPFNIYKGADESVFLRELRDAIASATSLVR
jgi:hypothetical protein